MYKSCGCMYGACDCGVDYSKEADRTKVHLFVQSLIPKDLYMFKMSGELMEIPRDCRNNDVKNTNLCFIGEIDDCVLGVDVRLSIRQFEEFWNDEVSKLDRSDMIDNLHLLTRRLTHCVYPLSERERIIKDINDICRERFERKVSDWRPIFLEKQ